MRRTGYYNMGGGKFPEVIVEGGRGFGGGVFRLYVFSSRVLHNTPFGDHIFLFYVFTSPDTASSRWCLRRRYLSLREERYRRKTRQRAPKPPFGFWLFIRGVWRGDVRRSYEFAQMQFTRFRLVRRRAVSFSFLRLRQKQTLPLCNALCGCKHCFRRTLAYCTNCG